MNQNIAVFIVFFFKWGDKFQQKQLNVTSIILRKEESGIEFCFNVKYLLPFLYSNYVLPIYNQRTLKYFKFALLYLKAKINED